MPTVHQVLRCFGAHGIHCQLHPHFRDACCRSLSVVPRGLPLKENFCIRTHGSIGLACGFVSSCVLSHSLGLLKGTCRFTKIWPRYWIFMNIYEYLSLYFLPFFQVSCMSWQFVFSYFHYGYAHCCISGFPRQALWWSWSTQAHAGEAMFVF